MNPILIFTDKPLEVDLTSRSLDPIVQTARGEGEGLAAGREGHLLRDDAHGQSDVP